MDINIEFSNAYTRAGVQAAFTALVLPTGAQVFVRAQPRESDLGAIIDAATDLIDVVKITEFTTWAEVSGFLNSLPAASFNRINRLLIK